MQISTHAIQIQIYFNYTMSIPINQIKVTKKTEPTSKLIIQIQIPSSISIPQERRQPKQSRKENPNSKKQNKNTSESEQFTNPTPILGIWVCSFSIKNHGYRLLFPSFTHLGMWVLLNLVPIADLLYCHGFCRERKRWSEERAMKFYMFLGFGDGKSRVVGSNFCKSTYY